MPHLDHLGLAVDAPAPVAALFETLLGLRPYKRETVAGQGVRTHFIAAGTAKLELLESVADNSPVARFLARRGEGVHHLAFAVDDVEATMAHCRDHGFTPLSDAPQPGADGKRIFFLHPKDTHGLLIEFCQSVSAPLDAALVPFRAGRLAAYEAGAAEAPPLLLLHGAAGCTQLETAALLRRMAPHYRVIALDFSGHGASDDVNAPFSAELFVDNVRAVLDHAGIDRAHVFGFSMGGYVALHFAHHHPDRVRRLAVHGATLEWNAARVRAMLDRLDADALRAERPARADQLAATHHDWRRLFRRMRAFVQALPGRTPALLEGATAIDAPTLVSAVDRDDLFPLDAPLRLHELLPASRLAIVPGRHHALQAVDRDVLVPLLHRHFGG